MNHVPAVKLYHFCSNYQTSYSFVTFRWLSGNNLEYISFSIGTIFLRSNASSSNDNCGIGDIFTQPLLTYINFFQQHKLYTLSLQLVDFTIVYLNSKLITISVYLEFMIYDFEKLLRLGNLQQLLLTDKTKCAIRANWTIVPVEITVRSARDLIVTRTAKCRICLKRVLPLLTPTKQGCLTQIQVSIVLLTTWIFSKSLCSQYERN